MTAGSALVSCDLYYGHARLDGTLVLGQHQHGCRRLIEVFEGRQQPAWLEEWIGLERRSRAFGPPSQVRAGELVRRNDPGPHAATVILS